MILNDLFYTFFFCQYNTQIMACRQVFSITIGGGFKYVLFTPTTKGNDPIWLSIFQMGWFNHQLDDYWTN